MPLQTLAKRLACNLSIFLLICFIGSRVNAQTISTVIATSDGDGKPATYIAMIGHAPMAVDGNDNIYYYDGPLPRIRKVSRATGLATTVAVDTFSAVTGLPKFNFAGGVVSMACDKVGNLYIAQSTKIHKLDFSTGTFSQIAGAGYLYSGDDGPAALAGFANISYIALDDADNLFIFDNVRIRKISASDKIIRRVAGTGACCSVGDNGPAVNASLESGVMTVDHAGNIYLTFQSRALRKIDASTGIIKTISGSFTEFGRFLDNVPAAQARYSDLAGVTVDRNGNIYLSDAARIRKISASTGMVSTIAGNGAVGPPNDGGPAVSAQVGTTTLLTASRNDNLFLNDFGNSRTIRKIDLNTQIIERVVGNGTAGTSGIPGPVAEAQLYFSGSSFAMDASGNTFISDAANNRIYRVDATTKLVSSIAGTGERIIPNPARVDGVQATATRLEAPRSISLDAQGNLYVVEYNGFVRKIDTRTGIISRVIGDWNVYNFPTPGPTWNEPVGNIQEVYCAPNGDLYLADRTYHKIWKADLTAHTIKTVAGSGSAGFTGDGGLATNARLNDPRSMFVDKSGDLYFSDLGNHAVRKVSVTTGLITTLAGQGSGGFAGDNGLATAAYLNPPTGLAVDREGNVFISGGQNIRKINQGTGIITRYAGLATFGGFMPDGVPATETRLNTPTTLHVDSTGNLYVFETFANKIRKISPGPASAYEAIIHGKIFYDENGDGIQNVNEKVADGIGISSKTTGKEIRTISKNGTFKILADTGIYETKSILIDFYSSNTAISVFTPSKNSDSITIALKPIPNKNDLQLTLISNRGARPGFPTSYSIPYKNTGTANAEDVKLYFVKSSLLSIDSTKPAYSAVSGDTLIWNLNVVEKNMKDTIAIFARLSPPPIANINDLLNLSAYFSQRSPDINAANDSSRLRQRITGAYDPNDKAETHGGILSPQQISSGEYLTYLIRFQNTGNDTAFNVTVRDTLSVGVNFSSLEMIAASHDYALSITDNNKLSWSFPNILLPDSTTNESKSHGFIAFRVKPVSSLALGDKVENTAHIYFDYNLPVTTNTVQTSIKPQPVLPARPQTDLSNTVYCVTAQEQKIRLLNRGDNKVLVWIGSQTVPLSADGQFSLVPAQLAPGTHALKVVYLNEAGENSFTASITIKTGLVAELAIAASKTTLIANEDLTAILATPKNGGSAPLYTFSKDRQFTALLQAEGVSNRLVVTGAQLNMGDNWVYVRMNSSEACVTPAQVTDSVKLIKNLTTTGVTDVDYPGMVINNYPNPVTNELHISGLNTGKQYSLQVFDSKGTLVHTYQANNTTLKTITTGGWKQGSYWIRIIDLKKVRVLGSLKVIKQ